MKFGIDIGVHPVSPPELSLATGYIFIVCYDNFSNGLNIFRVLIFENMY